jgi:hypothetical protein
MNKEEALADKSLDGHLTDASKASEEEEKNSIQKMLRDKAKEEFQIP